MEVNCFIILHWFCHTSAWIHHRCTWVPNPEPSSHHPPHILSLGHPSAPAPSIQYHASNLDWRFISYKILYMFQRHSPKSSHPLPLPPRCPSAEEWIRKLWYIYTMEYYSAFKNNTFESVLMRWMKLEPIIQSEVSQKGKHQYSILTHIYGI